MLDRLGPLGSIKAPSGTLEFGQVGSTACVFLRFVGGPGTVPCLVYTPEELASLLTILGYAERLSQTTKPGDTLRLGTMRAKPIILRLALIHPANGVPFVLLRMLSGKGKLDIPLSLNETLELLRQGQVSNPAPPLSGPLRRVPSGAWSVAGKELHVVPGYSPGQGYWGEYIHPDEVEDGEHLVVWPFHAAGKEYIGAFRTLEQWRPPSQVSEPKGQEGDLALFNGQTYRCRHVHKNYAQGLSERGDVHPTWAAKLALSSLLCDIADGEDESGHATWLGNSPDPILQAGISAIEQGDASLHDQAIYQQVSCYFHSLGADQDSAAHAVNTILERLFAHFLETDPSQVRRLLANWAMHLKDIYDGKPPNEASEAWRRAKAQYPGRVMPKAICFPPPYPWLIDWNEEHEEMEETVTKTSSPFAVTEQEQRAQAAELEAEPESEPEPDPTQAVKPVRPPAQHRSSKLPLLAVGVVCLGAVGFFAYKATAKAPDVGTATPTPTTVVASVTPQPSVSPNVVAVATPIAPPTMGAEGDGVVVGDLSNLNKVTIGGVDPEERFFVDRAAEGMTVLESGVGWARYEKDGVQIFMGAKQSGTRKSTRASAFASDALFSDGKKVLTAGAGREQIPAAALERLKLLRIQVVVDPATDTILGFSTGEFPDTTPGLGQPLGADLYKAFEERNLEAFQAGLTPETANLMFMDGESLFAKVARQAWGAQYCQAMIDAGADVQGAVGIQALWSTADPGVVVMLTKAGLNPDELGPQGRTKLFTAGPEMTKALLAAKANPNLQDESGMSPLFATSDPEVVALLGAAGADPNLTDNGQRTALMGADIEKTKALLKIGADPELKDKDGRTAADHAGPNTAIVELLKKAPKKAGKDDKAVPKKDGAEATATPRS